MFPRVGERIAYGGGGKGGGGGSSTPTQPTVLTDPVSGKSFVQQVDSWGQPTGPSASDLLNAEIDQRKKDEQATADTLKQQAADKATADETAFQGRKTTARQDALNSILNQFKTQGVDATPYLATDINPALDTAEHGIADLDPNPGSAYTADLGTNIINNLLTGKRLGATNTLNATFDPAYSTRAIDTHAVDPYVTQIVNEQFDPLTTQLTNAQKRGTLNDAGYQAALSALTQKKDAATSTVNSLGKGVLTTDRSALDDYISGARTAASNLTLAGTFDPTIYTKGATDLTNTELGSLSGDLRNAVGSTKFADLTDLLNAGGATQGATNPAATATGGVAAGGDSAAFASEEELKNKPRGIGSQGSF